MTFCGQVGCITHVAPYRGYIILLSSPFYRALPATIESDTGQCDHSERFLASNPAV